MPVFICLKGKGKFCLLIFEASIVIMMFMMLSQVISRWIVKMGVIVSLIGVAFVQGGCDVKTGEPGKGKDLEVTELRWETGEFGSRFVVGTLKNNTNKRYSYVQVEINLYDKEGNLVGSTLDNVNNLDPHGTWKFKAVVMEEDAVEAKLKGVTGW